MGTRACVCRRRGARSSSLCNNRSIEKRGARKMQTPIHIFIHGLVILLAGSMLNSTPSVNVFGALAVEDNMRPEVPMVSSYGMTLPIHDATLTIDGNSAVTVSGLNQGRLRSVTNSNLVPQQFIVLSGDR